ncbi:PRC-barrel domain-containing protein [Azoarcus sp. PA01]|nr:PRC-barrel domain-containing protein [Azoarcus sp. PA01]
MNPIYRKSLIASAIAVFVASPVWAEGDKTYKSSESGTSQPMNQSGTTGAAAGTGSTAAATQLQNMTPRELEGKEVVSQTGKEIGSVKEVVRSRDERNIQVVISAGGVMGMGDKEVAVPLDQLSYRDGKLHVSATEDELKARPEYESEQYVELEPTDRPISEFSAFEADESKSRSVTPSSPTTTTPGAGDTMRSPSTPDATRGQDTSPTDRETTTR